MSIIPKKEISDIKNKARNAAEKELDKRLRLRHPDKSSDKKSDKHSAKRKAGKKNKQKGVLTKPKIIAISGTPCTGKTTLSRLLEKELGMKHLDVTNVIKNSNLSEGYDPVKRCEIIDTDKLKKALITLISSTRKDIIIDSHMSHYLPHEHVDLCIITKCSLKTLRDRLFKRGYHKEKIRENLDSEIFDVCMIEALEAGHNVLIVETDREIDIEKIKARIKNSS